LQKDEARQLFVWAKKCASEEEEEQAKSRRYHTILYEQSVNNSIIIKISIINSKHHGQKHGNMIPYLKEGAQAISGHAQLRSSTTAAGKLSVVIRVRNRFKTSWQKHIAAILRKQNVIWCFLSQMLVRTRQRISPSRARFAGQRAVSAQFAI
jgi:hypothetical protein